MLWVKYNSKPINTVTTLQDIREEHTPWVTICLRPGINYSGFQEALVSTFPDKAQNLLNSGFYDPIEMLRLSHVEALLDEADNASIPYDDIMDGILYSPLVQSGCFIKKNDPDFRAPGSCYVEKGWELLFFFFFRPDFSCSFIIAARHNIRFLTAFAS